jgi:hypothetical protein
VSVWGPSTAALLAYAGAHGFSVFKALSLFNGGLGQQPLAAEGGLLVVAAIAAALVYDNALLASGRFLKQALPFPSCCPAACKLHSKLDSCWDFEDLYNEAVGGAYM